MTGKMQDDLPPDPRPEKRREPSTQAGFGVPAPVGLRERIRRKSENFTAKNRGLLTNPGFWRILPRLIAGRLQPSPLPKNGPILFVATHHKVMTTYFNAVLTLMCFGLRIPFDRINVGLPKKSARLFLSMQGKQKLSEIAPYRGVHIMRDPRDMIVSSYHYHKWTHETWAHRPDENGLTYQQKLNRANQTDGLFMEIEHFIFIYRAALEAWEMDDPDMLELSYESLMGPERDDLYRRIFVHLGFAGRGLDLGVDLMRLFEASSRTGRKSGATAQNAHVRSGKSGQWQDLLEPGHLAMIERELGDVMRKFGYSGKH